MKSLKIWHYHLMEAYISKIVGLMLNLIWVFLSQSGKTICGKSCLIALVRTERTVASALEENVLFCFQTTVYFYEIIARQEVVCWVLRTEDSAKKFKVSRYFFSCRFFFFFFFKARTWVRLSSAQKNNYAVVKVGITECFEYIFYSCK